jgi:ABC-2 type transport system ATP-binding protein
MEPKIVLEAKNLTKRYGEALAVEGLELSIREGEIFGLLGPNGSGKTTTMLMLMGLTEPTAGTVNVFGFDPVKSPLSVRRVVGYLPERARLYGNLTARANLRYIARLNEVPEKEISDRIEGELENVGLQESGDVKVKKFSFGMHQRLGLASVFIKEPKIALLDEPTIGLDPDSAQKVLETISNLSTKRKVTVLMSSHILARVRQICDRVGIMKEGRMIVQDTIRNLEKEIGIVIRVLVPKAQAQLLKKMSDIPGVQEVKEEDGSLLVRCREGLQSKVAETVMEAKIPLLELRREGVDLQEVYRKYTTEV